MGRIHTLSCIVSTADGETQRNIVDKEKISAHTPNLENIKRTSPPRERGKLPHEYRTHSPKILFASPSTETSCEEGGSWWSLDLTASAHIAQPALSTQTK